MVLRISASKGDRDRQTDRVREKAIHWAWPFGSANKYIALAGIYISPSNKNQSLEEIDNLITSSFLVANANYKAIVGDFNVNLDTNTKLGEKTGKKLKKSWIKTMSLTQ